MHALLPLRITRLIATVVVASMVNGATDVVRASSPVAVADLVGRWSTPGPSYLIFNRDGTVAHYTPIDQFVPRRGRYEIAERRIDFIWDRNFYFKAERETCDIEMAARALTLTCAESPVRYTR